VTIMIDPDLQSFVRLVATEELDATSSLRKYGMVDKGFLVLGSGFPEVTTPSVLFLIRPTVESARLVSSILKQARLEEAPWEAHVCFVPRRSFQCEVVWHAAGVWDMLSTVTELGTTLVPWDDDVMTMEWPTLWGHAKIRDAPEAAQEIAECLVDLQTVFGPIPEIKSKGDVACNAVKMLLIRRRDQSRDDKAIADAQAITMSSSSSAAPPDASSLVARAIAAASGRVADDKEKDTPEAASEPTPAGLISMAILIDRDVDPVTPLFHPLTVEALLDDIIGLDAGTATLPRGVVFGSDAPSASSASGEAVPDEGIRHARMHFNSENQVWTSVRDMHLHATGKKLSGRTQELKEYEEQAKEIKHQHADVMKAYIAQIPMYKAAKFNLPRVIRLLEVLKKAVEGPKFREEWTSMMSALSSGDSRSARALADRIIGGREAPHCALRLWCLVAAAEGSLRLKDTDPLRKALVESYGFDFALTLDILERIGLLRVSQGGGLFSSAAPADWKWDVLLKTFRLAEAYGEEDEPVDIGFVNSCLAPLSVRIVQAAIGIPFGGAPLQSVIRLQPDANLFPTQGGWSAVEAGLKACPGRCLEVLQLQGGRATGQLVGISASGGPANATVGAAALSGKLLPPKERSTETVSDGASETDPRKTVLVFFLGGVSFTEIAALRWLGERLPFNFVVAATHVASGRRLIEDAIQWAAMDGVVPLTPPKASKKP
jgi:vacuolar protein sorting-associated protein 33A